MPHAEDWVRYRGFAARERQSNWLWNRSLLPGHRAFDRHRQLPSFLHSATIFPPDCLLAGIRRSPNSRPAGLRFSRLGLRSCRRFIEVDMGWIASVSLETIYR